MNLSITDSTSANGNNPSNTGVAQTIRDACNLRAESIQRFIDRKKVPIFAYTSQLSNEVTKALIQTVQSMVRVYIYSPSGLIGRGSGIIFHRDGSIVTSYHVMSPLHEDENYGVVRFSDGSFMKVEVPSVRYSTPDDLATFRTVSAPSVKYVPPQIEEQVSIGDKIISAGFLGLGRAPLFLNKGKVKEFMIRSNDDGDSHGWFETTAFVGRGCSGGAFLNGDSGKLVGVIHESSLILPSQKVGPANGSHIQKAMDLKDS